MLMNELSYGYDEFESQTSVYLLNVPRDFLFLLEC